MTAALIVFSVPAGALLAFAAACTVRRWIDQWLWHRAQMRAVKRIRNLSLPVREQVDAMDAMAFQLEEIRALPVVEPYGRWLP